MGVDVATQHRNIRRYTIEKATSAVQDCTDGQRVIELCDQRPKNTLAELNQYDINETDLFIMYKFVFVLF